MATVMIIDDELPITEMLTKALTKYGHAVRAYNNPISALGSLGAAKPDVVLLDIMMPQQDGLEVLRDLKERLPDVKVIMMTAQSTLDRVLTAHKLGAESYILKPFDSLSELNQKITGMIKG